MATVAKRVWTDSKGRKHEAWRVGYTDKCGKRRFVQKGTKREAEAYRIKVEGELVRGTHTADAASITVGDACKLWLSAAEEGGCSRSTLKTYGEIVNGHVVPFVGSTKLSRLDAPAVVDFRNELIAAGRSQSMVRKAVRHLSMVLNEAVSLGLVAQNVAQGVRVRHRRVQGTRRKALAKRAEIPSQEHLRAMLEAADRLGNEDPRLPVMLRVVMGAGLRASELRAFSWDNSDLSAKSLTVDRSADRWNEIGAPKSDAGYRTIPIGPMLATSLKAWKLQCPPSPGNLMFPNRPRGRQWRSSVGQTSGGPIKQHTMAALLLKVQVAAGIAIDSGERTPTGLPVWKLRYDWHHLRHVAASNWLAQGVDLKRLQVWIGHENIQLTIDVYGHLMADERRDATLAAGAEAALLA